jgi:hypothetical protein
MLYTTSPAKVPARPIPIRSWPYCSTEGIMPAPLLRLCLGPAPIRDSHDAANTHQWGLTVDTLTRTMRRRGETSKQWQGSATGRLGLLLLGHDGCAATGPCERRHLLLRCAAAASSCPVSFLPPVPLLSPSLGPSIQRRGSPCGRRARRRRNHGTERQKKTMLDPACRYGSGYTRRSVCTRQRHLSRTCCGLFSRHLWQYKKSIQ